MCATVILAFMAGTLCGVLAHKDQDTTRSSGDFRVRWLAIGLTYAVLLGFHCALVAEAAAKVGYKAVHAAHAGAEVTATKLVRTATAARAGARPL